LEFLEVVAKVHFLELILGFRRVVKLSPIPMPDDDAVLVAFIEHHTKISKGKSVPRYQDFRGDGPYIYWLCVCFCGFMWDKYSLAAYDRRKHTAGKKASSTVIREASFPNPVDRNISRSDKPGMQVVDLGTPPENPKNPWSSHDLHYIECDDVVDD